MVHRDSHLPGAEPSPSRRSGAAGQVLVVLCLLGLLGLGVRSLVAGDGQFGWGMFAYNTEYLLEYRWLMADGGRAIYIPGKELQAKAAQLAPHPRSTTLDPIPRRTWYTLGGLRRWIPAYLAYLYDGRRPAGAIAIEARLRYVINDRLRISGTRVVRLPGGPDQPKLIIPGDSDPDGSTMEMFRHPVGGGEPR